MSRATRLNSGVRQADATAMFAGRTLTAEDKLLPFRIDLADRVSTRVDILVVGDSQTEGQGCTDVSQRWVQRLATTMRSRLGLPSGGRGYIAPDDTGQNTYAYPGAAVGSPALQADKGAKAQGISFGSAGQGCNYTLHGTHMDLIDVRYSGGGSYTYAIDGGAPVTVSTNGAFTDGNLTRVALGSSGPHTVQIRQASGTLYHTGVIEYDGDTDAGLLVHDCGHFGWTAAQWNTNLGGGSGGLIGQAINALTPNLVVIPLGHNEIQQSIAPSAFSASLNTLIATLRAAITDPNPPFLLLGYPPTAAGASAWQPYLDAMQGVAASDSGVAFLDVSKVVPDHSVSSIYYDTVHGNRKWHGLIADAVAAYLVPGR